MSKVNQFKELKCWQASRKLVSEIYCIAETGILLKDYNTKSQLKRADLSSMSNIDEGFGKFGNKKFIRYLDIAQSSVLEVKSILYVLRDMNYLVEEKIEELHLLANDVRLLTLGLISYLRTKENWQ